MKRKNYFQVHKNKRPKKAKYSCPYNKLQKRKMEECTQYFMDEIFKLKNQAKPLEHNPY